MSSSSDIIDSFNVNKLLNNKYISIQAFQAFQAIHTKTTLVTNLMIMTRTINDYNTNVELNTNQCVN